MRRVRKHSGGLFSRRTRKHGGTKRRVWRKIHIHCPAGEWYIRREGEFTRKRWKSGRQSSPPATSEMSSRQAPPVRANRRGILPELPDQIPADQQIASVTADGAFDTPKCHDAIAARGAAAIIPPRKNAKPWKPDSPGALARNEALRASKRSGRTIWRRWSGYHRRSRVETKMHCVNRRSAKRNCSASVWPLETSTVRLPSSRSLSFAGSLEPMAFARPFLNGFTALGIPVTETVGWVCPGKREVRPSTDLCNKVG